LRSKAKRGSVANLNNEKENYYDSERRFGGAGAIATEASAVSIKNVRLSCRYRLTISSVWLR
jgi:hypothetical protein